MKHWWNRIRGGPKPHELRSEESTSALGDSFMDPELHRESSRDRWDTEGVPYEEQEDHNDEDLMNDGYRTTSRRGSFGK